MIVAFLVVRMMLGALNFYFRAMNQASWIIFEPTIKGLKVSLTLLSPDERP